MSVYVDAIAGLDSNAGTSALPVQTVTEAVSRGPGTIYLRSGRHYLNGQAIALTSQPGVKIRAYPGEVARVSGGTRIAPGSWTCVNPATDLWRAAYTGGFGRTLWLGDIRCGRSRAAINTAAWAADATHYTGVDTADLSATRNRTRINLVLEWGWIQAHMAVASATATTITPRPLAFASARDLLVTGKGTSLVTSLKYIENWYEAFVDPTLGQVRGTHYIDEANGLIYVYRPRDADMSTVEAHVGTLDGPLVSAVDCAGLEISGVVFEHNTSGRADGPQGHICAQSNTLIDSTHPYTGASPWGNWPLDHAAVELDNCPGSTVSNNVLQHLGTSGLWLKDKTTGCKLDGNTIVDVASNGAVEGDPADVNPATPVGNNRFTNTLIRYPGQEFQAGVGLLTFYPQGSVFANGEIAYTPHTGASLGYGWGQASTSTNKRSGNVLRNVRIHDCMLYSGLKDGGALYLNGTAASEVIDSCYIANVSGAECHGLYLDDGCCGRAVSNCVVAGVVSGGSDEWGYFNNNAAPGSTFTNMYTATATRGVGGGTDAVNTFTGINVSGDPVSAGAAILRLCGLVGGHAFRDASFLPDARTTRGGRAFGASSHRIVDAAPAGWGGEMTITFKFRPNGWASGDGTPRILLHARNAAGTSHVILQRLGDNNLYLQVNATATTPNSVVDTGLFADGKDVCAVLRISAGGGYAKLELNGKSVANFARAVAAFTAESITLGNYHTTVGSDTNAAVTMWDYARYSSVLSNADAAKLTTTHPSQVSRSTLVDCWDLKSGVAPPTTELGDSGGHGLTVTGATAASGLAVSLGAPPPPAGLSVVPASSTSLQLNWASVSSGQTPQYRVYRAASALGSFALVQDNLSATTWTDTGRTAGTEYFYLVTAFNDAGESSRGQHASAGIPSGQVGLRGMAMSLG